MSRGKHGSMIILHNGRIVCFNTRMNDCTLYPKIWSSFSWRETPFTSSFVPLNMESFIGWFRARFKLATSVHSLEYNTRSWLFHDLPRAQRKQTFMKLSRICKSPEFLLVLISEPRSGSDGFISATIILVPFSHHLPNIFDAWETIAFYVALCN